MLFQLNTIEVTEGEEKKPAGKEITSEQKTPDSMKLEDVLQLVAPGCCVHWVTKGDWSMHDLLIGLLHITGPADVLLSSYAFSEYPARIIADLKQRSIIKKLGCLIDSRIDVRSASALSIIRNIADAFLLLNTHSKITILENETMNVIVIGSANYTTNKRYETGVIISNTEAINFHKNWMQHELDKQPAAKR